MVPTQRPAFIRKARVKNSTWTPDTAKADRLLEMIQNVGLPLAFSNWNEQLSSRAIASVLSKLDNWETGLKFFNWAKSRRDICEITVFGYNMLLKLLRDGEQLEHSENLLREMMLNEELRPDNFTFSIFLGCCKRCGKIESAVTWFHRLLQAGVTFDEVTYSSMIDLYAKAGRTAEAMDLYTQLRKNNNWRPDIVFYGVMVNVYSRVGDYEGILGIFGDMERVGVRPNVVLFNMLLGTLSRAGKVNLAKEVFDSMGRYGLQPSEVTLSIYIEMFTNVGALNNAVEVYDMIKRNNWKCNVTVYNALLRSCVDSGNIQRAEHFMHEMHTAHCLPDHITYGILMNIYATRGLVSQIRSIFMEKASKFSVFPKATYYTMVVKACRQSRQFSEIPKIFEEMVSTGGCELNYRMSSMLLLCVNSPHIKHEERLQVVSCISRVDPLLHRVVLRLLNFRVWQDNSETKQLMEDIRAYLVKENGEMPRRSTCNAFIDLCWVLNKRDEAEFILKDGIANGLYEGIEFKLPTLWQLNLRTLSFFTAECAINMWVKTVVCEINDLPNELMVETGTGRAKEAIDSLSLSGFVHGVFKSMEAPFVENAKPGGYFIATGEDVKAWLESRRNSKHMVNAY